MDDRGRLAYLDALRAVAILGVVMMHSGLADYAGPTLWLFMISGARGVQLFFVISGFAMMYAWHAQKNPSATAFFIRRFCRIAPMYYVGIVGTLVFFGYSARYWAPDGIGPTDIVVNLSFLHAWFPNAMSSVVAGGWSIGDEMMFYLLVPLIVTQVRGPVGAAVMVALSLALAWACEHWLAPLIAGGRVEGYLYESFVALWPPAQFPAFCWGILAYFVWRSPRVAEAPRSAGYIMIFAALSVLVYLIVNRFALEAVGRYSAAFALLLVGLSVAPVRVVVNRPLILIGRISYSMYIVHFLLLEPLRLHGIDPVFALRPLARGLLGIRVPIEITAYIYPFVLLAVLIAVSWLTYELIEKPFIRLGAKLGSALPCGPSPPANATRRSSDLRPREAHAGLSCGACR